MNVLLVHDRIRDMVNPDDVVHMNVHSRLFLSMCLTLHDPIYRNALQSLCTKYTFLCPFVNVSLEEFELNYKRALSGEKIEGRQITNIHWKEKMDQIMLELMHVEKEPTNEIFRCVHHMLRCPLHRDAMYELCEIHGLKARLLVHYVLLDYKRSN